MFPAQASGKPCGPVPVALVDADDAVHSLPGLDAGRRGQAVAVPVLDGDTGPVGRRLAHLPGRGRPVLTYLVGVLGSWVVIAGCSIVLGLLLTQVILTWHGVAHDDERIDAFLARHRSGALTDASLVGSIIAGGVVLPVVAGVYALVMAARRHWRLAAFLPFALALESASYRATTMVVHRHRPPVHRLEQLPVDASYPSGHMAASIAVYGGLALILTSRLTSRRLQVLVWAIAALVPVYVAFSRMYRGMHHPLDVLGGVLIGVAALAAMVVVSRASRLAALERLRR